MRARHWVLSVALLGCAFTGACSANQKETKAQPSSVKTMLETLVKIDESDSLSVEQMGNLLQVKLELSHGESDQYIYVFHGRGGQWHDVELRVPKAGNSSKFVLILHPVAPLPMDQVQQQFGKDAALDPPNPNAPPEQALTAYVYKRKQGIMRFAFPSFKDFNARIILIDRMG